MRSIEMLQSKLGLHKYIRLRRRYVLTRRNKIRLRYSLGVFATLGVLAVTMAGMPSYATITHYLDNRAMASAGVQGDVQEMAAAVSDSLQDQISSGIRRASVALKKPPVPLGKHLKIGAGDTVAGVLQQAGLSSVEAYQTVEALKTHFDPRKIKPGQELEIHFKPGEDDSLVYEELTMKLSPIKSVSVAKDRDGAFAVQLHEEELKPRSYAIAAEIETSLYGSAVRAGIPPQVIAEVIRIYSWDVDFQRDIRQGDKIEVLYSAEETEAGDFAKYGDVLYASLSVGGKEIPIYRYEMKDGRVDYFEPDGMSIRKTLMKTPIDGARLSSGFGMRHHPVLGYNKMHQGIDFAAPAGTPIYAAGDGTVTFMGRNGGYGNFIKLRHNSTLKTAYAHMHKFGPGIATGKRVEQGDIIGYVGTTGRSTGPHLHYEVLVNNVQKNPNDVDLPTGEQLGGDELKRFKGLMGSVHQQYVSLNKGLKFARHGDENEKDHFFR